jgi:tetratricopeptide (TPR) repeat protein
MKISKVFSLFLVLILIAAVFSENSENLKRGIQLFNEGKLKDAKSIFEKELDEDDNNAEAHLYMGRIFLRLNNHDDAVDHCEKAAEQDENNADYHFWLGNAYGMKAQNSNVFKQAWLARKVIKEFEKAVEIDSTHLAGHIGCANFYLQAPSIMGGGMDKARESAEKVSRLNKVQGVLLKARILAKEEKPEQAIQLFDEFEKNFDAAKHSYRFYNMYGYFLLGEKKYEKAIEMFEKQIQLAPDQANPYDSLGDGLRAAGRLEEALEQYKKAAGIDPESEIYAKHIKEVEEEIEESKQPGSGIR